MNGRIIAGFLLGLLLVAGAAAIGITAYNAGVTQGLVDGGQVVVAPGYAVGPYVGGYGGWGHGGFGFFGFLGALFFILILFALIRAAFGGGRRGWGGPGWGGPGGGYGRGPWNERARELHDELHRQADQPGNEPKDQNRS